jgi:Ca2+-binding EF-hand superfamily protein
MPFWDPWVLAKIRWLLFLVLEMAEAGGHHQDAQGVDGNLARGVDGGTAAKRSREDDGDREDDSDGGGSKVPRTMSRVHSRTLSARVLATSIADELYATLNFKADELVSATQMAVMLRWIMQGRTAGHVADAHAEGAIGSSPQTAGWQRWAEVEARAGVHLCDADGDGYISKAEFVAFLTGNPTLLGPLTYLESLFSLYDTNNDGALSVDELRALLGDDALSPPVRCHGSSMPTAKRLEVMTKIKIKQIPTKIKQILSKYDADKSKAISFDEFLGLVFAQPELLGTVANLRQHFEAADTNGDGTICATELQQMVYTLVKQRALRGLRPTEAGAMDPRIAEFATAAMARADSDGDGKIDFGEFVTFCMSKPGEGAQELIAGVFAMPLMPMLTRFHAPEPDAKASTAGDAAYSSSWLSQVHSMASRFEGLEKPSEKRPMQTCANCRAPVMPGGAGTTRYGFFHCSLPCYNKHKVSVEFETTQQHADTVAAHMLT